MPRYQSNFPRATNPWWFRGLIALGAIAFLVSVMANAAQAAVLNPDYYQDVLHKEAAYARAYAELSRDPELLGVSQDLLGGIEIPFLDQVPGLLVQAIPVQLVERQMDRVIEDLIAYLKKHKKLTLTLDITPFVDGAGSPGLDAAIDALTDLSGGQLPELDEGFGDGFADFLDGLRDEGRRWDATPGAPGGSTGGVLRLRTGPGLPSAAPAVDAQVVPDLRSAKFVREEQVDGETRYLLGPPQEIVDKIDSSLFMVQLISANSYWMRPAGIVLCAGALAALAYLSRHDRTAMARRLGIVLLAGGLVGAIGWLIAFPIFQNMVIDAAFEGGRAPSEAFDDLARDVLRRLVSNITPYIWLPTFVAAGIGGALVVLARFVLPGQAGGRAASGTRP